MKTLSRRLHLCAILLCPAFVRAQGPPNLRDIQPVDGYFSSYSHTHGYYTKVRDILLKGVTDQPDAMVVTLPSFEPETAMVLKEQEVTLLQCSKPIWDHPKPETITIAKRTFQVSKELADAIHVLWFDALSTTAYPKEASGGCDGSSLYFTVYKTGSGLRAGEAWSPWSASLPGQLSDVACDLETLAKDGEGAEERLLKKVRTVHAELMKREGGETPTVDVYLIRKLDLKVEVPQMPATILEIANPTQQTFYLDASEIEKPVYDTEAQREDQWLLMPRFRCGTGKELFPLRPGTKLLVTVSYPWDEPLARFRFYFYTSPDPETRKVVSVRSRTIERKELGDMTGTTGESPKPRLKKPLSDEELNKPSDSSQPPEDPFTDVPGK